MNKILPFILFLFLIPISASGQNSPSAKDYFFEKLDTLLAGYSSYSSDYSEGERTNPQFYKLFVPTVLYKSTIKRGLSQGFEISDKPFESEMELDENRSTVIDNMLFSVYGSRPSLVRVAENDMRNVVAVSDVQHLQKAPEIDLSKDASLEMPETLQETLETKPVKPNYWRTSGSVSLSFTQNYVSDNWAQGGENNRNLITNFKFKVKYDDKKKISFETNLEAKLGFITVSGDSLHNYRTNNDMLRLETKFGYKILKNVDLTAKMTMQTQFMPSYPTNEKDFVSNFMAPFEANFSLGLDYKRSGKNWELSLYFAPLSSYNYKFVRYGYLADRYGIYPGRQHTEDFGTQIQPHFKATVFENVVWEARLEYYTNYARTYFNWENTISMKINKYLNTTLFLHGRFDDSSPGLYSESHGYWQMKEYMSLGVTYTW